MCNQACVDFIKKSLNQGNVRGKSVIEVGALNVNGSARAYIETLSPAKYIGVDIEKGPGVDEVCDAEQLLERFNNESFDILISTEVIEHVKDWKLVLHNFKNILKPGGMIVITTRSFGYPYHGYPYDYWRFETSDFESIFSDFKIQSVEKDLSKPGAFIAAVKPDNFIETALSGYRLFSMICNDRVVGISAGDIVKFKILRGITILASKLIPGALKPVI